MLEDREGTLWVATENRVLRFRAATQEEIGAAITLPGPLLSGPLQDKNGSIWFSTDKSVARLDPDGPQGRLVKMAEGKFWLSKDAGETIRSVDGRGCFLDLSA